MTDLNTMTTSALVTLHNALPGARQLTVKTFNKRAMYVTAIEKLQAEIAAAAPKKAKKVSPTVTDFLTPADIATQMEISAYEVRVKLRAARAASS